MINTLLIFFGAGLGGVFRFWISNGVHFFCGRQFPYGTLVVNLSGSFVMGVLYVLILERSNGLGQPLRALLLIGFLGGYTTFSAFSIETLHLIEAGESIRVLLNILLSVILCVSLTWLGVIGARSL